MFLFMFYAIMRRLLRKSLSKPSLPSTLCWTSEFVAHTLPYIYIHTHICIVCRDKFVATNALRYNIYFIGGTNARETKNFPKVSLLFAPYLSIFALFAFRRYVIMRRVRAVRAFRVVVSFAGDGFYLLLFFRRKRRYITVCIYIYMVLKNKQATFSNLLQNVYK